MISDRSSDRLANFQLNFVKQSEGSFKQYSLTEEQFEESIARAIDITIGVKVTPDAAERYGRKLRRGARSTK